jgi:hypothetical protein
VYALTAPDRLSIEMLFVANGRISRTLENQTRRHWIVRVDFQEVTS